MNDQDLWQLNIIAGPGAGDRFPLSGQTSLGTSSDNQSQLSDPYVASHYATITRNGPGQYYIAGIINGSPVYVNGQAVNASTWLQPGDYIQIGGVQFQVVAVPQPTAAQSGGAAKKSRTPLVLTGVGAGCLGLILCGVLIAFGLPYLNRADDIPESSADVPANQPAAANPAVFTTFDQLNQELSQGIAELNLAQLRFIERTSQALFPARLSAKQVAQPSLDDVLKEKAARAAHVAQVAGQLAEMTANDPGDIQFLQEPGSFWLCPRAGSPGYSPGPGCGKRHAQPGRQPDNKRIQFARTERYVASQYGSRRPSQQLCRASRPGSGGPGGGG